MMSVDEKKSVAARFFNELWNDRRLSVAHEIVSSDCVTHQLRSGSVDAPAPRPPQVITAHVAEWLQSFPDIHFVLEQLITEGDLVAVRCTATGTHRGTWLGLAPTGRQVSIRMAVTFRVSNGKIVEDWVLVDFLGVLQQLGVLRPTAELIQDAHSG